MGKLSNIRPLVGSIASPVGRLTDAHGHSDATEPWRRWYKTARWQKLRWSVLVRDMFTCFRCQRVQGDTSLLVAHHKRPHRGDPILFWDPENLTCACKDCHDGPIAAEEAGAQARGEL